MESVALNTHVEVALGKRQVGCYFRNGVVKGIVEAGTVDRRWKNLLRGGNERQRLRDVQRREMSGGTKLVEDLRCDELVRAEGGPSVYDAMPYGNWSGVNMIRDYRSKSGKSIALRLKDTFTDDGRGSVGKLNLECAIALSNALGASGQERFLSIAGAAVDGELER